LEIQNLYVRTSEEIEPAFQTARKGRAQALLVSRNPVTAIHHARIAELAVKSRLPMYADRRSVEACGLKSYGEDYIFMYRRVAYYVDKILRGAKPADLPVEQPMTFEFVVNMKTAQALGITFPNEIMLQVTEVIQ
jgi:putative ABC transport system substrate-binding protein